MAQFSAAAIARWCSQLGRDAADFVYGRSCVCCQSPLPPASEQFVEERDDASRFCLDCYEQLSCSIEHFCGKCGAPVGPFLKSEHGCRHCRRDEFHFCTVLSLGTYEGLLKSCCNRGKQSQTEPLVAGLAELLWDAHREEWPAWNIDLVIPVPHHWTERVIESHLASETIGRVLARRLKRPASLHILAKRKRTPRQSSLSPSRRRTNLRGAFQVVGGARLDGLHVLLTDDVLTTGTTADRAARELRAAGAKQVVVAVLARGVGHRASY